MKTKGEIDSRIAYHRAMEHSAKAMVTKITEEECIRELLKGEQGKVLLKWLTANVAWSVSMARQDELQWVQE